MGGLKRNCVLSSFVISLLVRALWHGLDDTTIMRSFTAKPSL